MKCYQLKINNKINFQWFSSIIFQNKKTERMNEYPKRLIKFSLAQLEKKTHSSQQTWLRILAQDQHDLIAVICIWMQLTGPVLWGNQAVCNMHKLQTQQKSKAVERNF